MRSAKPECAGAALYENMTFAWNVYVRMTVIFIAVLMVVSCRSSDAGNKIVSISEVGRTTSPHATTRQFQRKVHFVDGRWYVFYSNGRHGIVRSSADGRSWSPEDSEEAIIDEGIRFSSGTDVIFDNDTFFYFSSLDDDPSPDRLLNTLYVLEGRISGGAVRWGDRRRVFERVNPDDRTIYSSVSMDPEGYIWAASRHVAAEHSVIVTRSVQKRDTSAWTPRMKGLRNTDAESMAPKIIGVGNGKAYLVAKATRKGTVFGNFYNGEKWEDEDSIVGSSSKVAGDDKRMTMVFEPGAGSDEDRIHLVYIDDSDLLRHRVLSSPYGRTDWFPPLDRPGSTLNDPEGRPIKAYTCILSIDKSAKPAKVYLLYGETLFRGKDPRQIMGELRLLRFTEGQWSRSSLLMSEEGTKKNWYPNMIQFPERKIGVLYMKGTGLSLEFLDKLMPPRRIMFSSADIKDVDRYFDQMQHE